MPIRWGLCGPEIKNWKRNQKIKGTKGTKGTGPVYRIGSKFLT